MKIENSLKKNPNSTDENTDAKTYLIQDIESLKVFQQKTEEEVITLKTTKKKLNVLNFGLIVARWH